MIKTLQDFSIEQIANSGQCFRINKHDDLWEVWAAKQRLEIKEIEPGIYEFFCSEKEFEEIWFNYFDLSRNYGRIKEEIKKQGDYYLNKAIDFGRGLRILKQDPWEVMIHFLISQQNNIPRIKKIIENLCQPFDGVFPSMSELQQFSLKDFEEKGLGYRAKYLKALIEQKPDVRALAKLPYQELINKLKTYQGIGDKVANCIALFGFGQWEAFPRDVWINRIIKLRYQDDFPIEKFKNVAGLVQQYLFFYERSFKETNNVSL